MISAIIVAAGRGTRMGPDIDKIFLPVLGQPLVAHTWSRFDRLAEIDEIVLVVRSGLERDFEEIGRQGKYEKPFRLVPGGGQRQDSVWNGLEALAAGGTEIVVIQDGARPCTPNSVIVESIGVAREWGAAVAAQRVVDTIKASEDGREISEHLRREKLWAVQTPQTFQIDLIRRALNEVRRRDLTVTDDTAACELIGQKVRLVESQLPNPKLTHREDIPLIERLLSSESL